MKTISQRKDGTRKEVIIDGRTCHIRKNGNVWYKTVDGQVWADLEYGAHNTCSARLLKSLK